MFIFLSIFCTDNKNHYNFVSKILDFFWSGQFVKDVIDIVIQVVADALGLNMFIY